MYIRSLPTTKSFIINNGDVSKRKLDLYITPIGDLYVEESTGSVVFLTSLNIEVFYNIKIVVSGAFDGKIWVYIDDSLVNTISYNTGFGVILFQDCTLGAEQSTNDFGLDGILYDVNIYSEQHDSTIYFYSDTLNNSTNGIVFGTEQYAIISESYEGISVQKTKRFTGTNTTEFEHTIQDFYYGGEITLASDSDVEKTFILIGYDDKKDAYYLFKKEKTTDSTVTFNPEDVYFRKLIIRITSETSTYFASYNMEHIFDIFSDAESVSCNSGLVDNFVYYNNVLIETRQVSFKVPKEYSNIANSLFSNKLYLDDVEYLVLGKNKGEFDIDNLIYNISFMRVFK